MLAFVVGAGQVFGSVFYAGVLDDGLVGAVLAEFEDLGAGDGAEVELIAKDAYPLILLDNWKGSEGDLVEEEVGDEDEFVDVV